MISRSMIMDHNTSVTKVREIVQKYPSYFKSIQTFSTKSPRSVGRGITIDLDVKRVVKHVVKTACL